MALISINLLLTAYTEDLTHPKYPDLNSPNLPLTKCMNSVGRIDSKTQFYSLFPSLYSLNALTTNLQFTLPLDPSNSGHMFTVPNYMDQLNNYQGLQKK